MKESKRCKFCKNEFFKKDFPRVFHRMITCGKTACKNALKKEWTFNKTCPDCGAKISKQAKRCNRCSCIGDRNPFYGKTHTKESKSKIKLFKKGHIPSMKGKHHSLDAKIKNSIAHQKDGNIKPLHFGRNLKNAIRHSQKYKDWRRYIFARDNFTCQNSKCKKCGVLLEAHHKIKFSKLAKAAIENSPLLDPYEACILYEPMWDIKNGKTLCMVCHRRKEGKYICKEK